MFLESVGFLSLPGSTYGEHVYTTFFLFFPLHPMDWSAQQSRPACFLYFFLRFMLGWNNPLPIGQSVVVSLGGGRKRYSQSRPHPEVIAPYPWARDPRPREWETSRLATTRLLISKLATARGLCFFPPTTPAFHLRPHCHLRRYRWQRSQPTRAATFPQRLRQWTFVERARERWNCLDGFWF